MRSAYIPSPCIDVCRIDESSGQCAGCHRTLDEICMWTRYSDDERAAIMAALPARRGRDDEPA
jgi:predicted Fe-S protein YdhL (DUF1289 family)